MKSTLLNRKLLALVVTALLLGALALVNPAQRELPLGNAQINSADVYEGMAKARKNSDPDTSDGFYTNS